MDAPSAYAFTFWTRTNRYLRERLIESGWTYQNREHILRTIRPSGDFAITSTSGSGAVGTPVEGARTKNPKGTAIANIVEYNSHLYGYFGQQEPLEGLDLPFPIFESDAKPTWFLLYRFVGEELLSELSLPVAMHGKYVDTWLERIILDALPHDGGPGFSVDLVDGPEGPDDEGPDVPVERLV